MSRASVWPIPSTTSRPECERYVSVNVFTYEGLAPRPHALLPREALKDCVDDALGKIAIEGTAEDEAEIHRPSQEFCRDICVGVGSEVTAEDAAFDDLGDRAASGPNYRGAELLGEPGIARDLRQHCEEHRPEVRLRQSSDRIEHGRAHLFPGTALVWNLYVRTRQTQQKLLDQSVARRPMAVDRRLADACAGRNVLNAHF